MRGTPIPLGFVFIHGGGLESWVWKRLISHLRLPAIATHRLPPHVKQSRLSVADCVDYIQEQIDAAGFEKTILVAHSIGGILAPYIAIRNPERVAYMVFIGATIPREGETTLSTFAGISRVFVALGAIVSALGLLPQKVLEPYIRKRLCLDLDAEATEQMVHGSMNSEPLSLFFEPISRVGLPEIPRTYLTLQHDQAVSVSVQESMAANINAQIIPMESGHAAMLSKPIELAQTLNSIAESVQSPPPSSFPLQAKAVGA